MSECAIITTNDLGKDAIIVLLLFFFNLCNMLLPLRNPETILLRVIAMTVVPYIHSAAQSVLNQQYLTNLVFLTAV